MTVSERVALAQKIEELEQGPAAERMASTLRQGKEVPLGSADPSGPKAMPGERIPRSADVTAAGAVAADLQVLQGARGHHPTGRSGKHRHTALLEARHTTAPPLGIKRWGAVLPAQSHPPAGRDIGSKGQGKKSGYRPGHGDHRWRLGFPSAWIWPVRGRRLPATLRRWRLVHAGRLPGRERLLSGGDARLRSAAGPAGSVDCPSDCPRRRQARPDRDGSNRPDKGGPGRRDPDVPAGDQSPPGATVLPLHAHLLDVRTASAGRSRATPWPPARRGSTPTLPARVRWRSRLGSGRLPPSPPWDRGGEWPMLKKIMEFLTLKWLWNRR